MVEGIVDGFTPSGRVWVRVTRRAYGSGGIERAPRVHLGADRLTIVTELPASSAPTNAEAADAARQWAIERARSRIAELEAGAALQYGFDVHWWRALLSDLEEQ
jgi:hypothetical protein